MGHISHEARVLGLAGLLPQVAAVLAVAKGGEFGWSAEALGFGYAALIFSFLGGVWWGLALASPQRPGWIWLAAVAPSLIALALWFPWMVGWTWPAPEMVVLGALIAGSPLVDRTMSGLPAGWMTLRWQLSLGLGAMTALIGVSTMPH